MRIIITVVLLIVVSTGSIFLFKDSDSTKTDATMVCTGMQAMSVKFIETENSGSFKVKIFSDGGGLSQILHAPAAQCLIVGDPK